MINILLYVVRIFITRNVGGFGPLSVSRKGLHIDEDKTIISDY